MRDADFLQLFWIPFCFVSLKSLFVLLFTHIILLYHIRELPRVLTIYDIDMPIPEARQVIRGYMEENAYIRDPRVQSMLIEKGYMELEETLLHYKQRPHLMKIFHVNQVATSGPTRKRLTPDASIEEQFNRA